MSHHAEYARVAHASCNASQLPLFSPAPTALSRTCAHNGHFTRGHAHAHCNCGSAACPRPASALQPHSPPPARASWAHPIETSTHWAQPVFSSAKLALVSYAAIYAARRDIRFYCILRVARQTLLRTLLKPQHCTTPPYTLPAGMSMLLWTRSEHTGRAAGLELALSALPLWVSGSVRRGTAPLSSSATAEVGAAATPCPMAGLDRQPHGEVRSHA